MPVGYGVGQRRSLFICGVPSWAGCIEGDERLDKDAGDDWTGRRGADMDGKLSA